MKSPTAKDQQDANEWWAFLTFSCTSKKSKSERIQYNLRALLLRYCLASAKTRGCQHPTPHHRRLQITSERGLSNTHLRPKAVHFNCKRSLLRLARNDHLPNPIRLATKRPRKSLFHVISNAKCDNRRNNLNPIDYLLYHFILQSTFPAKIPPFR